VSAATAADQPVCLAECVYCNSYKSENDDSYENITDDVESLLPDLVAHSDGLECTPETVSEVESESCEPYDVDEDYPPVLECSIEKEVWIFSVCSHELLKLHLCPEMVEVEGDESENYDSENKHVLRSPGLSLALASGSVA